MPSPATTHLPRPKSWDEFEDITADVLKGRWQNPNVTRNGRNGQAQNGVDIYGLAKHLNGQYAGAQCKNYEEITWKEIAEAVAAAEGFDPPLAEFVIATTAPRDSDVQRRVRLMNVDRLAIGRFPVEILFWEDLSLDLAGDKRLLAKHFPDWSKLDNEDKVPLIEVHWVSGDVLQKTITVDPSPWKFRDLRSALNPFSREEISYLENTSPEDAEKAQEYNRQAEEALADNELRAQWLKSKAEERVINGRKIGLAVSVDGATAQDILITLLFPDNIEIYSSDAMPTNSYKAQLPKRPRLEKERRLVEPFGMTQAHALQSIVPKIPAFVPPVFRPPFSATGRSISVSKQEIIIRIRRLAPRRIIQFSGKDESVRICPLVANVKSTVQWRADAENLPGPIEGTLELTVNRAADEERLPTSYIGPPLKRSSK